MKIKKRITKVRFALSLHTGSVAQRKSGGLLTQRSEFQNFPDPQIFIIVAHTTNDTDLQFI